MVKMMVATTALTILLSLGLAAAAPTDSKIVGGEATTIEENPFQLELQAATLGVIWAFECGAVIVGPSSVATAGHCVKGHNNPSTLRVLSGATDRGDGVIHKAEVATLHPDYQQKQGIAVNDIAYLKVSPPFDLSESTQIVNFTRQEPVAGDNATISGWGTTSETSGAASNVLRRVTVPIVDRESCIESYGNLVDTSMICAGLAGKDSCSGDSGGPLIANGVLSGLVSWGQGCAEDGYPGVYTNVAEFADWLQEQIDANES